MKYTVIQDTRRDSRQLTGIPFFIVMSVLVSIVCQSASAQVTTHKEVALPFQYVHGISVVELQLQAEQFSFVVDTGCDRTLLSLDDAKRLNLKPKVISGNFANGTGSELLQTYEGRSAKVAYQGLTIARVHALMVDFTMIERRLKKHITGILCMDLFQHSRLMFDFESHVLTLNPQTFPAGPSHSSSIQRSKVGSLPLLAAELDVDQGALVQMQILLDTGSDGQVTVNNCTPSHDVLTELPGWKKSENYGLGGSHKSRSGLSGVLRLAGFGMPVSAISLSDAESGTTCGALHGDGLLGVKSLQGFTVLLDMQTETYTLFETKNEER